MNIGKVSRMVDPVRIFDYTEADRIFETSLKPLKSRYARAIYWIFLQNIGLQYLTTLDIQNALEKFGHSLSKKEINASLKALFTEGILGKDDERGKPTTLNYDGRYTYDKWRITSSGLLLSQSIQLMVQNFNGKHLDVGPISNIETQVLSSLKEGNDSTIKNIADMVLTQIITDCVNSDYIKVIKPKKNLLCSLLSKIGLLKDEIKYRITTSGLEHLNR